MEDSPPHHFTIPVEALLVPFHVSLWLALLYYETIGYLAVEYIATCLCKFHQHLFHFKYMYSIVLWFLLDHEVK